VRERSRRVLVTGGSGYFGSVMVQALRDRGCRVRVFDLNDASDRPDEVEFVQGDIRDQDAVLRACDGMEIVHHNVAQVPLARDRALFQSVNVGGTRTLLEACLARRVQKVVNVSSSAVFGAPPRNPVDASVEPHPREAYGAAKLAAERVATHYIARGLDITTIRPRTILGHGRLGIFQILFELVRLGKALYVLGKGDNRYQFVHADDLADACIRAGEREGAEVYNIGAEQFGTMRQLLEALVRHAGTSSVVRSVPMEPAVVAMNACSMLGISPLGPYHSLMYGREMFFDIRPARQQLGWAPRFSNEQAICESYDAYQRDREEVLTRRGASHHRSGVRFGVLGVLRYLP
jgi:nucleoside-diphosphate-sugar epimerase